jgi:hypothetical protein
MVFEAMNSLITNSAARARRGSSASQNEGANDWKRVRGEMEFECFRRRREALNRFPIRGIRVDFLPGSIPLPTNKLIEHGFNSKGLRHQAL